MSILHTHEITSGCLDVWISICDVSPAAPNTEHVLHGVDDHFVSLQRLFFVRQHLGSRTQDLGDIANQPFSKVYSSFREQAFYIFLHREIFRFHHYQSDE